MEMFKVALIFMVYFMALIPSLKADIADFDDVWKQRAEEAQEETVEAYVPNPLDVADEVNLNVTRDFNNHESFDEGEVNINGFRRLLVKKRHKKYRGPCLATNPIDKCWRCRKDWAKNRKQLARCGLGFGRRATGGLEGKIYIVTDNSDNDVLNPKPGTLRHAVIQTEPLWIIFAYDMNIKLKKELLMTSHKTIDGRGANVHISYGGGIMLQFIKNVIIHGVHIHHIVATEGGEIRDSVKHSGMRTKSDGDGISIYGSLNIWIDHVSMSNCADGLIDAVMGSTAITISNCHFTHHDHTILLGASDSFEGDTMMQVTLAFNHFGQGLVQRMPRCRWGFFHVVNNNYIHWKLYAIGGSQHPTIISQGNRFIAPADPVIKEITHRDYASEAEWRKWTWRSENDLLVNGAIFRQSAKPNFMRPHKKFFAQALPGVFASQLTRFAGALKCKRGRMC